MECSDLSPARRKASLILKFAVVAASTVGAFVSASANGSGFMGRPKVFMLFTGMSVLLTAFTCAVGAVLLIRNKAVNNGWFVFKYVGTVAITVTGAAFAAVLVPMGSDQVWNVQNFLTHALVPAAAIADFFITGVCGDIKKRHIWLTSLPFIAYTVYSYIVYATGGTFASGQRYPYFFLNWGSPAGAFGFSPDSPYMGCVWWVLSGITAVLFIGLIYVLIITGMRRRNDRTKT